MGTARSSSPRSCWTVLNSLAPTDPPAWLLSPLPVLAVQIAGLLFEVIVVGGLGRYVPGVHVGAGLGRPFGTRSP